MQVWVAWVRWLSRVATSLTSHSLLGANPHKLESLPPAPAVVASTEQASGAISGDTTCRNLANFHYQNFHHFGV